jgi:hypothetical protein
MYKTETEEKPYDYGVKASEVPMVQTYVNEDEYRKTGPENKTKLNV